MNKTKVAFNKKIMYISIKTINKVDGDFAFHKLLIAILFSLVVILLFAFSAINLIAVFSVLIFFLFIILYF